ncbi:MAG: VWA domain-containing protein [Sandaracinaceae bacterium]|nr:VWA domain-containing protein [Sandaracinaceae bacterium]
MGIASPLALLAALLIALPIAAHILRRRDLPSRILPTVAFLERAITHKRRRIRLVDILILILRMGVVILAAIGMAEPFMVGASRYGEEALALAIVIDDSASMAQLIDFSQKRSALDEAVARAIKIIESLPQGSEIAIVAAGAPPRLILPRTKDIKLGKGALLSIQPGARRNAIGAAIKMAERQLGGASLSERRILLLSDQSSDESIPTPSFPVELEKVIGSGYSPNIGIVETQLVSPDSPNSPWLMTLDVRGSGFSSQVKASLRILSEDLPSHPTILEKEFTLLDGSSSLHLSFHPPKGIRKIAINIETPEDRLPMDNRRVLPLEASPQLSVLFVEGSIRRSARFAIRALEAASGSAHTFLPLLVDADRLPSFLADYRSRENSFPQVIVVSGFFAPSPESISVLEQALEEGSGLLVAPEASASRDAVEAWARWLPARPVALLPAPSHPSLTLELTSHLFFRSGPTGLEGIRISSYFELVPLSDSALIPLRIDGDHPFLVFDPSSRRAVLSVGLDDRLSDFPIQPGFLPLLVNLVLKLAPPEVLPAHPISSGDLITLPLPATVKNVEIQTPSGLVFERNPGPSGLDLSDLAEPGIYELRFADSKKKRIGRLVVVPPPEEIDLSPRLSLPRSAPTTSKASNQSTTSLPLSPLFFFLSGLFAIAEGWLRLGDAFPLFQKMLRRRPHAKSITSKVLG